jgi:hypothetical protein
MADQEDPPDGSPSDRSTSDSPASDTAVLAERVAELTAAVAALDGLRRADHDRAAARDRVIDRLHEENQRLRAGERLLLLRPILTDLHRLRDDLLRQAASLPAEFTGPRAAGLLESFAATVEQALERGGIRVVRPAVDSAFEPVGQRVTATETTDVADLDVVADRMLAPAAVRVRRWRPDPVIPTPTIEQSAAAVAADIG